MRRPRVMVVGGFPPSGADIFGGVVTSCNTLVGSSFAERFDLSLVDCAQSSIPPPALAVRIIYVSRRFAAYVWRLFRLRPDCVLIFSSSGSSMIEKGAMGRVAQSLGIPVLMFPRGGGLLERYDQSWAARAIGKFALRPPEKVLCQGQQWQEFVTNRLGRAVEDAPIVRNWTATTELLQVGNVRPKASDVRPIRLLFVGWVDRTKGVFELLEAFRRLSISDSLVLTIVGDGIARREARAFVDTHGLADRVKFPGWLHGVQLLDAYKHADVFVLPSWSEGLPNAMIEAMAARLPVVVAAVGNVPGEVSDGNTGLLVPPRDPDALERALRTVIKDCEYRERLAHTGYQQARKRFSVERAVEEISNLIHEVVD